MLKKPGLFEKSRQANRANGTGKHAIETQKGSLSSFFSLRHCTLAGRGRGTGAWPPGK